MRPKKNCNVLSHQMQFKAYKQGRNRINYHIENCKTVFLPHSLSLCLSFLLLLTLLLSCILHICTMCVCVCVIRSLVKECFHIELINLFKCAAMFAQIHHLCISRSINLQRIHTQIHKIAVSRNKCEKSTGL